MDQATLDTKKCTGDFGCSNFFKQVSVISPPTQSGWRGVSNVSCVVEKAKGRHSDELGDSPCTFPFCSFKPSLPKKPFPPKESQKKATCCSLPDAVPAAARRFSGSRVAASAPPAGSAEMEVLCGGHGGRGELIRVSLPVV